MTWTKADIRRMRDALTSHMLYARDHQSSDQIQAAIDARRRYLIEHEMGLAAKRPAALTRDPGLPRTLKKLLTGVPLPLEVEQWTPLGGGP